MIETNRLSKYLDILQIYRGIAALMVVIHHTLGSIGYYHRVDNFRLDYIQAIGKYGVDFFFVLSGFIISYTAYLKNKKPKAFNTYIKNRFVRIYVPYLPIGILMYVLYIYLPQFSNAPREISEITTFTLFPAGNPALSVAWTLSFEIIFYILFSWYFISVNVWRIFCLFWFLFIILFNLFPSLLGEDFKIITHLGSLYNLEFILGTFLTYIVVKKYRPSYKIPLVMSAGVFILFLIFKYYNLYEGTFVSNGIFSIFCFLLIYISIAYRNITINKKNIWMLIGNATFSIYLLHDVIQTIVVRLFPKINLGFRIFMMLIISILVSCFLGYFYYRIFEVRTTKFVRNIL